MTLGQRLQKARKESGLSQEELAEQLGVSRQAVSKWENDSGYPEMEKMIREPNLSGQPGLFGWKRSGTGTYR